MHAPNVYLWHRTPALRLLLPLMAGIAGQWYLPVSLPVLWIVAAIALTIFIVYALLSITQQFKWRTAGGIMAHVLMAVAGMLLVYYNNVTHHPQWLGKQYTTEDVIGATLQEPLVEKANSYKALATVNYITHNNEV